MRLVTVALFNEGTSDYPFYVEVAIEQANGFGLSVMAPLEFNFFEENIREWCEANCAAAHMVGSQQYVHFASLDDAVLFRIAYS